MAPGAKRPSASLGGTVEVLERRRMLSATVTTLATFHGLAPVSNVAVDKVGNVYGAIPGDGIVEITGGTHEQLIISGSTFGYPQPDGSLAAADAAGNVYAESFDGKLFEISAGTHLVRQLAVPSGLQDLTADAMGNLYGFTENASLGATGLVEIAAGTHDVSTLATFSEANEFISALCRDGAGDLFWVMSAPGDGSPTTTSQVAELAAGTHNVTTVINPSNSFPAMSELVCDAAGDLFATDGTTLVEIAAGTRTVFTLPTLNLADGNIGGLLLDAQGNLFALADLGVSGLNYTSQEIFRLAAGTHALTVPLAFAVNYGAPDGFAADAAGNLYECFVQAGIGSATGSYIIEASGTGFVPEPSAPTILAQPSSESEAPGGRASFAAVANPNPASTIQWQVSTDDGKTFTDIAGNVSATAQTLTLNDLTQSQNGTKYRAIFTNSLGTVTTDVVKLAVEPLVVVSAAHASPSTVTGTTTTLSALGAATSGEAGLTYKWSVIDAPAGAASPSFSTNNSNAARQVVVTFHKDGHYLFGCIISDGEGNTIKTDVQIEVTQEATSLRLSPHHQTISDGETLTFHATVVDQFGHPLRTQPAFTYSVLSGPGTINSTTGLFASPIPGAALIQAEEGDLSGVVGVQVIP